MKDELRARFTRAYQAALGPGMDTPRPRLPEPLLNTLVHAAERAPERLPTLLDYFTKRVPDLVAEQRNPHTDLACALLQTPLDFSRTPHFYAALEGAFSVLSQAGLSPLHHFGALTPSALLQARPTPLALNTPTLFGTGLPMLGVYPHERPAIVAEIEAGRAPEAVFDARLSAHLMHELAHGLHPEDPLPEKHLPWVLQETIAAHLGFLAYPEHLLPRVLDAPAIPAAQHFVLLGLVLERRFGRRALLSGALPPSVIDALEAAEWSEWLARSDPAAILIPDMTRVLDWVALVDTASPGRSWREQSVEDADWKLLEDSLGLLCVVHRMRPHFRMDPSPLPHARVVVDVVQGRLEALPRPDGVWAEPAFTLLPPPIARALEERGHTRFAIEGVTAESQARVVEVLQSQVS